MASPSTAITRFEYGTTFNEFDAAMNEKGYIGPKVLRPRVVGKQAADVGKVPIEARLQQRQTKRAPGAGYNRADFEFTKYAYSVEEYGAEEVMDDAQIAIYGDIIDAEDVHAQRAESAVCDEYERDVAAAVFDTAVWTGAALTTAVATPWSTHATADPVKNVFDAIEKVVLGSGLEPNALVLNRKIVRDLLLCEAVKDMIKYTAVPTAAQIRSALAELFDLPMLLVAGGLKNIANAEKDVSISRIWPNGSAMVAKVAVGDDPREACIGRTFIWPGDGPGAPGSDEKLAVVVEEYREENKRGSVLRARNNRDIVIMYKEAGHLLTNLGA